MSLINLFKEQYSMEESYPEYFYHGSKFEFDSFNMDKVGTGDGLNKFGFGLYFTDTEELAAYYAMEDYKNKGKGKNIYQVRLKELSNFYNWEDEVPDDVYNQVISSLKDEGFESDAEEIEQDYQDYGDRWSVKSLYEFLQAVLKSDKKTSEFLYKNGISGVIADDLHDRGKIYVAYSDKIVKIIDQWRMS
jgi:hypothetical protein